MARVELKVIIAKMDGEVLDVIMVDGEYLKPAAAYPEHMLAQCIKEALEENFETRAS